MSWKSSSRTATPLAHAAHSGETARRPARAEDRRPGLRGWRSAWARALATGARASEAAATPASSIRRLTTISVTSASTATGSVATAGELPGQLILAGQPGRGRMRAYLVLDHFRPPQATIGAGIRLAQAAMFIPKPTSL